MNAHSGNSGALEMAPAGAAPGAGLAIGGLEHGFGDLTVIEALSLSAAPHEVLGLVGPSGCGKSTLLELICGLAEPRAGTIAVGAAESAAGRLARCAYMPQRDLLLPWYSALDNATLALRNRGVGKQAARAEASALFGRF